MAIASVLKSKLAPKALPSAIETEVYDLFLKAQAHLAQDWSRPVSAEVAILMEQVVARAPDFAPAWGLLASLRVGFLPQDRDSTGTPAHEAAAAAARALRLDPTCAHAIGAQAVLKPAFSDYAERLRLIDHALRCEPNGANTLTLSALGLGMVGRNREALVQFQKCADLNPLYSWPNANCAIAQAAVGEEEVAIKLIEEAAVRFPQSPHVWSMRVIMLMKSNRWMDAEQHLAPDATIPSGVAQELVAVLRRWLGITKLQSPEQEQTFGALLSSGQQPLNIDLLLFAAQCEFVDMAYSALFAALDTGATMFGAFSPRWFLARAFFSTPNARLRNDPRFATLCARLGLVDYWMTSGHWPDCATEVPYDFKAECENATREAKQAQPNTAP